MLGIVLGSGKPTENRARASQPGRKMDKLKYNCRAVGSVWPRRAAGYRLAGRDLGKLP